MFSTGYRSRKHRNGFKIPKYLVLISQQKSFLTEYLLSVMVLLTGIKLCLNVTGMLLLTILFSNVYVKNVAKDFADIASLLTSDLLDLQVMLPDLVKLL